MEDGLMKQTIHCKANGSSCCWTAGCWGSHRSRRIISRMPRTHLSGVFGPDVVGQRLHTVCDSCQELPGSYTFVKSLGSSLTMHQGCRERFAHADSDENI